VYSTTDHDSGSKLDTMYRCLKKLYSVNTCMSTSHTRKKREFVFFFLYLPRLYISASYYVLIHSASRVQRHRNKNCREGKRGARERGTDRQTDRQTERERERERERGRERNKIHNKNMQKKSRICENKSFFWERIAKGRVGVQINRTRPWKGHGIIKGWEGEKLQTSQPTSFLSESACAWQRTVERISAQFQT